MRVSKSRREAGYARSQEKQKREAGFIRGDVGWLGFPVSRSWAAFSGDSQIVSGRAVALN